MNPVETALSVPGPRLKSELARYCLPQANRDANRKLAWTNSICCLFLLIGIFGAKKPVTTLKSVKPIEEAIPVVIEPQAPPPQPAEQTPQENVEQDKTEAPQVVAVTMESPAVNFSIPTIGNVLVPSAMAAAPPIAPLKQVAAVQSLPTTITSTGQGGERPQPYYPPNALKLGMQGSVVLSIRVNEQGRIAAIEVKQSSGFRLLDKSALEWVKQHWIIPPADNGSRLYEATITYRLSA